MKKQLSNRYNSPRCSLRRTIISYKIKVIFTYVHFWRSHNDELHIIIKCRKLESVRVIDISWRLKNFNYVIGITNSSNLVISKFRNSKADLKHNPINNWNSNARKFPNSCALKLYEAGHSKKWVRGHSLYKSPDPPKSGVVAIISENLYPTFSYLKSTSKFFDFKILYNRSYSRPPTFFFIIAGYNSSWTNGVFIFKIK